ncbi:MAG: hypothetical protein J5663_07405 [Bacteroidaceae bacterium]|nr:hypothetical protein [Bacteroidaceae bacterium]
MHTAGIITTNGKMAGGIVGDSWGASTIQSCHSSVTISSSISGDGTHGGLVGRVNNGTLTINDCLFDGSITGTSTNSCGGFVGWKEASLVLNRCLQAGELSGISDNGGATFCRYNSGSVDFTTCYYRMVHGSDYGSKPYQGNQTSAIGSTLQGLLGSTWEVSGDYVFPIMDVKNLVTATIGGVNSDYICTGDEIKPEPTVTAMDGTVLIKDMHYSLEWSGDGTTAGDYSLTITGISPYYGSLNVDYIVSVPIIPITTSYVDAAGTLHEVEAIPLDNTMTTLSEGTYVVNSNVKYTSTVTIAGDVTLILADGYTMSIGDDDNPLLSERCMYSPYNLTIYGQSLGTGYLKMYSNSHDGIYISNDKNYTQHSGNVLIVHHSGSCIYNGNVILRGGTLDVESGGNAYGDIYAKTISILGGKLWARFKGLNGQHGITLGFTNSTDLIYAYKYNPNGFKFEIVSGQTLVDEYGCPYSGTLRYNGARYDFEKNTLRPVTGVTLTKSEYDYNDVSVTLDGTSPTMVNIPVDVQVNAVTLARDFSNGKYATLILPFSMTDDMTLVGANIYQFVGVEKINGQWVATMATPTLPLQANIPYLVEPITSDLIDGKLTFDLNGGTVTLKTGESNNNSSETDWQFVGTYKRLTYGTAPFSGHVYGFASKNKTVDGVDVNAGEFVCAKEGAAVPPLRCFLTYKNGEQFAGVRGMTRGTATEELPQSITVRLVGTNGETTNIVSMDIRSGELSTDGWYSMDGMKLDGKPTKKGLYIHNGKKEVLK